MAKSKPTSGKTKMAIPERKPHRKKEKPTQPNRQIPERVPQRKKEKQNFPAPTIPEHTPHRTREKPTKLKP